MQFLLVFFPLLSALISLSSQLPFSVDKATEAVACSRNPQLPYCGEYRQEQYTQAFNQHPSRTVVLASRQRVVDLDPSEHKDQAACRELRVEYTKTCTRNPAKKSADEFCSAYENVCFEIPRGEPDQPLVRKDGDSAEHDGQQLLIDSSNRFQPKRGRQNSISSFSKSSDTAANVEPDPTLPPPGSRPLENPKLRTLPPSRRDYSEFCAEYKQRFLYVCPDPFRFGQRAAVFCPIYSERCKLSVPDKPMVPTPQTPAKSSIASQAQRICGQYRSFAANYCGNPFALLQNNVREGCDKYRRFCVNNQFQRFG